MLPMRSAKFALVAALALVLGGFRHICSSDMHQASKAAHGCEHCPAPESKSPPCCPKCFCDHISTAIQASAPAFAPKPVQFVVAALPAVVVSAPISVDVHAITAAPPGAAAHPGFSPHLRNHSPPQNLL